MIEHLSDLNKILTREHTASIPDHQVLLSFNDDQHALVFEEWLHRNWQKFVSYYEKGPDDAN